MTYKINIEPSLFRAHNNVKQSGVSNGARFNLSNFYGCVGTSNSIYVDKAFVYGETRSNGTSGEIFNTDAAWSGGVVLTMLSEGYQIRNNVPYSVNMDDGIYGVLETEVAMIIKSTGSASSDIDETRIFGVRLP